MNRYRFPGDDAAASIERGEVLGALDLGSNSFHMIIARVEEGSFSVVDKMKETVRLADGLDENMQLTKKAQKRGLECIARFSQMLATVDPRSVRAVGTSTLRRASNAWEFIAKASDILGVPIDIISGHEEARLIYQGVRYSQGLSDDRHLIVDIGGGSTEIIIGEGTRVMQVHSLDMGCVHFSRKYFKNGKITKEAFEKAELAAALKLRPIKASLKSLGWADAIGTSGTNNAIYDLVGVNDFGGPFITSGGLDELRTHLLDAKHVDKIALTGLAPDRQPVLPGGLAVLTSVFRSLKVKSMDRSLGALREGVLFDLMGRMRHQDVRDLEIQRLMTQYRADAEHAGRVEALAVSLVDHTYAKWKLDPDSARQYLSWAAKLHEIGLAVSYSGYHKHSAYLVSASDLAGFASSEQRILAHIIRCHRKKLSDHYFEELSEREADLAIRLAILLRIAVLVYRSRAPELPSDLELHIKNGGKKVVLDISEDWLGEHALTLADLEREESLWRGTSFRFVLNPV